MAPRTTPPPEAHDPGAPVAQRADARRNRARILDAAEEVFAAKGQSASTEEIARLAGVAIGTVFRHFPTKQDLLTAIIKQLLTRLTDDINALIDQDDPTALFLFFTHMVEQAAAKKTIVDLLADTGIDVPVTESVHTLHQMIGTLLTCGQRAGVVRADIHLAEVMALLTSTAQGAVRAGWDHDLQRRTLAIIFAGLRPAPSR